MCWSYSYWICSLRCQERVNRFPLSFILFQMLREFVSSGKIRVYSEQRISKSVLMMKGNFKKIKSKAKNISFLITIWNGDETRNALRCCHAYHKSANTCSKRMSSNVSLCNTPLQVSIKTKHIWIAGVLEPFRRRFAAEMSDVHCSFRPLVGGFCTFARRDKAKSTEIVPLLTCEKDISSHISSLAFADVENEVDLLLARSAIFTRPKNIGEFTICPSHRSNLGVGWYRGSTKCRVPEVIARHWSKQKPKAERGIGKHFSRVILQETGAFIAVGSGLCSSSPILTILKATRKQVLTSFTHLHCSQGICRDCRMMLSEDKPPHSPEATDKEQDHPIGSSAGEMALVSQFQGLTLVGILQSHPARLAMIREVSGNCSIDTPLTRYLASRLDMSTKKAWNLSRNNVNCRPEAGRLR